MDDSAIVCHEVIDLDAKLCPKYYDETKTIPTNFNKKKVNWKMQNFYILLAFLLITIALLIAVSIYFSLAKFRAKQKLVNKAKTLWSSHDTKLKQVYINNSNWK